VQLVKGGNAGGLVGLGTTPRMPVVSGSYSPDGELILGIDGDFNTASFKLAISSTHVPTDVETRAGVQLFGQAIVGYSSGVFIKPGHPLYVSVFAYTATGVESSPLASRQLMRQGGAFDPHRIPHPGLFEEERVRAHGGGYPVPGQRFHGEPYMDDTGGIPLIDPVARRVGPLLQGNDGEPGIESQRAATRKGAQAAGHGAHGIVEEEHHRAGIGGIPLPLGRVHAIPLYDASGGIPLIDTVTRKAQATLLGPAGTGMDVVEDGGNRSVAALEVGGIVAQGTTQRNGTSPKNIASGRYAIGTGTHASTISFPTNYQNPPAVNILGGISYEPASVWGTALQADAGGTGVTAPNAARQIDEVVAYNVTTSGATLRAQTTPGERNHRAQQRVCGRADHDQRRHARGDDSECAGRERHVHDRLHSAVHKHRSPREVLQRQRHGVPRLLERICVDAGRELHLYSASDPVGGAADTGLISDTLVATVAGLTATSKFRLRLVTNTGAGARTYSVDPGNVTYTTTTGDLYATKTPGGLGINLSVEVIGAS
jgi:hypothetical protein